MKAQANPDCETCNGTGHIYIDSLNSKRCKCLLTSLYAQKLGRLFRVSPVKDSPLLKKLDQNMFLVVDDSVINPHLKAAFVKQGLNARWAYVTDSDVLQAFLGQSNSVDAGNVQELAEYPFLVLRLGVQGYKNIALSGTLCELLMSRVLSYRPTWIVSPRALTEHCLEYSDELVNILHRYYESNAYKRRDGEDHREMEREVMESDDGFDDVVKVVTPKGKSNGNRHKNADINDIAMSLLRGKK